MVSFYAETAPAIVKLGVLSEMIVEFYFEGFYAR